MTTSLKIFIPKNENAGKTITLDDPIILSSCSEIFIKSISVFWDYNNLSETYFFNYDIDGVNTKVSFKEGYYTFNTIKNIFEGIGDTKLEEEKYTAKCKIRSDKKINLRTLGPILGFILNKEIAANTLTESDNTVNINNNLEYINISCNMIDKSKNLVNGKRSDIIIQIPITTHQILKGSVSRIYPPSEETKGIKLSNGIYNEIKFKVEGNNSSSIGNFLLEIIINK